MARVLALAMACASCSLFACGGGGDDPEPDPAPSSVVTDSSLAAPLSECPTGGIQVDAGIDDDRDGVLDPAEVDVTQYVCNGLDGAPGAEALVRVTPVAAGAGCTNGGSKVSVGLDLDGDGVLGDAEVTSSSYVCTGATGPAGPSLPVVQSLYTDGPAAPGGTLTAVVLAQSAEGLALTYSWAVTAGWNVTAGGTTDTVTILAPDAYGASGLATVTVSDSAGRIATGAIALSTPQNLAPIIASVTAFPNPVRRGEVVTFSVSASDLQGDGIAYVWTVPAGFTILGGQGTAQLTAVAEAFTSGTASVTVSDAYGGASSGALFVATVDGSFGPVPELLETFDGADTYPGAFAMNGSGAGFVLTSRPSPSSSSALYARRISGGSQGPQWLVAEDASNSAVAVDSAGNAIAIFAHWDASGTRLHASRFGAASGGWDEPRPIGTSGGGDGAVAFDDAGNAVAIWLQNEGTARNIYANRYVAATDSWGTAQLLETDTREAFYPTVAVDVTGNAIAAWSRQQLSTAYRVRQGRYDVSAGAWSAPQWLALGSAGAPYDPQVAMDGAGNAFVVVRAGVDVQAIRYDAAGKTWGSPVTLDTSAGSTGSAALAMDGAGNAVAVWTQWDGTYFSVYAGRYGATAGSWGAAQLIESGTGHASGPRVAMDPAGNAIAAWDQSDGTNTHIWSSRFAPTAGAWDTAVKIETASEYGRNVELAMDAAGNAVAVWSQAAAPRMVVFANRYVASTAMWGAEFVVEQVGTASAGHPQVATSRGGDAMAVWHQEDGGPGRYARRWVGAEGRWGRTRCLNQARFGGSWGWPQVAVDDAGNAIAVWGAPDGATGRVFARRFDASLDDWTDAIPIDLDGADANSPRIAMNPAGDAVVVWMRWTGTEFVPLSNRFAATSGSWGPVEPIGTVAVGWGMLEVALDATGAATVVWDGKVGAGSAAFASRQAASGDAWGAPTQLGATASSVGSVDVDADVDGNATAAWSQTDGSVQSVRASRFDALAGSWAPEQSLGTGRANAYSPRVALDASGDAVAVWFEGDTTYSSVYWSRYDAAAASWGGAQHFATGLNNGQALGLAVDPAGNAIANWQQFMGGKFDVWSSRYMAGSGWGRASKISQDHGSYPSVALDGSGSGLIVWGAWDGTKSDVWWSRFE